jgi:hypothetical protein
MLGTRFKQGAAGALAPAAPSSDSLPPVVIRVGTTTSEYALELGCFAAGGLLLENKRGDAYSATLLPPPAGCAFEFAPRGGISLVEVPSKSSVAVAVRVRPGAAAGAAEGVLALSLAPADGRGRPQQVRVKLRAKVTAAMVVVRGGEGRGGGGRRLRRRLPLPRHLDAAHPR